VLVVPGIEPLNIQLARLFEPAAAGNRTHCLQLVVAKSTTRTRTITKVSCLDGCRRRPKRDCQGTSACVQRVGRASRPSAGGTEKTGETPIPLFQPLRRNSIAVPRRFHKIALYCFGHAKRRQDRSAGICRYGSGLQCVCRLATNCATGTDEV
jgi:hypothetical protein